MLCHMYHSHHHFLQGVAAEEICCHMVLCTPSFPPGVAAEEIYCQMVPCAPSFPPGGRGRGNSLSNGIMHTIMSSGGSRPRKFVVKLYVAHNHFLRGVAAEEMHCQVVCTMHTIISSEGVAAEEIHCQRVLCTPSFSPRGRGRGNSL